MYFRVNDPIASVANVSNADFATRLLAQTTLRNVLGTKNLAEVLSDREGIAHSMQVQSPFKARKPLKLEHSLHLKERTMNYNFG